MTNRVGGFVDELNAVLGRTWAAIEILAERVGMSPDELAAQARARNEEHRAAADAEKKAQWEEFLELLSTNNTRENR